MIGKCALALMLLIATGPFTLAASPPAEPLPSAPSPAAPPYEEKLVRLAELLGSIHYLRNICGEESGRWRAQMEALLEAETPSEERRAGLVAGFNRGYRAFAGSYATCTEQALTIAEDYMKQGAILASEIAQRYGN